MRINLKKIFPLEINFEIKNFKEYFKKNTIELEDSKNVKRIFFLDAATYNNLGDQAISFSISKYIQENFKNYEYVEISEKNFLRNFRYLKKHLKDNDILCLSGGGNMGNLYPKYEAIRRKVIKQFKSNKIVIFPQTIDYDNDWYGKKELKRSIKVYNSNKNLIICAREKKSYDIMKKIYNNVILVSDIVFYLYGRIDLHMKKEKIIGVCLRNDKESILSSEEKKFILNEISKNSEVLQLSTMSEQNYIDEKNRKEVLKNKLEEFQKCNMIITDRLHGMIFSIICNTPCIVFDNSNQKVSGVLEMIDDYSPCVYKLNKKEIEDISNIIKKMSKEEIITNNQFNIFYNLEKFLKL